MKTSAQKLYEELKGSVCRAMAMREKKCEAVVAEHEMTLDKAADYIDDSLKATTLDTIAMMRATALFMFLPGLEENLDLWNEVCDRLEKECL